MSMMIHTTQDGGGRSIRSTTQSGAGSEAQEAGGLPSFCDVLSKTLLPDAELTSNKGGKPPVAARHREKPEPEDKLEPAALLMGMSLPILLPEPKPGHLMSGGHATAVTQHLNALKLGPANRAERDVPGLDTPPLELLPAAAPANLKDVPTTAGKAPAAVAANEMSASEPLTELLSELAPVSGDTDNTLFATLVVPAAVSALTAAVQTLTQNLRRTTAENGQALVPTGKDPAAHQPPDPLGILGQTRAAENRSSNFADRGDQSPDHRRFALAGLSNKPGQPIRNSESDAATQQAASAKAELQFSPSFGAPAADNGSVVSGNAVASPVSARMDPAGASSVSAATLRPLLTPVVGSQGWDKALSQHMVNMGKAGHQITELQLNPPGLGPLKVTLDLNDHQMQLTFVSNHASVRAAVEAAVPQLRATLADNGISLGNTSVSAESQAQTQTAFSQGQGRGHDHRAYPNRQLPETAAPMAQAVTSTRRQGGNLAVDTYA
jgi:flagellar hook-length control protein FliK